MTLPRHLVAAALLACLTAPATAADFLPDTTTLLRVEDRMVTVRDFVATYYSSWAEHRPNPDSAGRVQFLRQYENREILGWLARNSGRQLGFEERAQIRAHEERVLSNVLFQRLVLDSVSVAAADVEALRHQYALEKNLQHILFRDAAIAERVRAELVAGKVTWKAAHKKYSTSTTDPEPEGGLGWVGRGRFSPDLAVQVFDLPVGGISAPYADAEGIHLVRVAAERPGTPPVLGTLENSLRREIERQRTNTRVAAVTRRIRQSVALVFDTTNVRWVAGHFKAPPALINAATGGIQLQAETDVPHFEPADTGRVLARWNGGQITLGPFMAAYRAIAPMFRQPAHTPDLLAARVEAVALEPYRHRLAVEMGMAKDPAAIQMIEKKREELLVERLYQDSVRSRIYAPPAARRKYYDDHVAQFITYPTVRYAAFPAGPKDAAEALAARLRAGADVESIIVADSIRTGKRGGRIREMRQSDEGRMFHKMLFEDMRPGQVDLEPEEDGGWWVIKSLAFDAGHQLTFEEAEVYCQEAIETQESERLLDALLERHRRRLRIDRRPELVMRIDLSDPMDRR